MIIKVDKEGKQAILDLCDSTMKHFGMARWNFVQGVLSAIGEIDDKLGRKDIEVVAETEKKADEVVPGEQKDVKHDDKN